MQKLQYFPKTIFLVLMVGFDKIRKQMKDVWTKLYRFGIILHQTRPKMHQKYILGIESDFFRIAG